MKIIFAYILGGILLIISISFLMNVPQDIYYNRKDNSTWKELQNYIESNNVTDVSFGMSNLEDLEKDKFIEYLIDADFHKSNWRQEGPTGRILTITFEDDRVLHFSYWGGGILETSYSDGQFLVVNINLENFISELRNNTE